MENNYRAALKKFWSNIWHLRRGKECSANNISSGGGDLLTSNGAIVRWWKKYFKKLLNPIDTPSTKDTEAGDFEVVLHR